MTLFFRMFLTKKNIMSELTPWIMEPGESMPYSKGLSNNPYPETNQLNSSYCYLFI